MPPAGSESVGPAPVRIRSSGPLRVLVVDDDADEGRALASALRALGCAALAASTGQLGAHLEFDSCELAFICGSARGPACVAIIAQICASVTPSPRLVLLTSRSVSVNRLCARSHTSARCGRCGSGKLTFSVQAQKTKRWRLAHAGRAPPLGASVVGERVHQSVKVLSIRSVTGESRTRSLRRRSDAAIVRFGGKPTAASARWVGWSARRLPATG